MNRKHIHKKCLIGAVSAAAMMISACSAAFPCFAEEYLTHSDFDDGVGLPWHTVTAPPAKLDFEISDGTYNITILNNGGEDVGGQSRWDCQFRHRQLEFYAGDSYTVKAEMSTDQTGEIYTKIGNYAGDIEIWHNGYGALNEDYGIGWNCIPLKAGQTLKIDSTWTASQTLELAEWAWQFGGAGLYQAKDCFPEGTVLKFNNLSIINNSREGTTDLKSPYWTVNDSEDDYYVVAVNHQGYHTKYSKKATVHSYDKQDELTVYLVNAETGSVVYQETVKLDQFDEAAGYYTAVVDFTNVQTEGEYYFTLDPQDNEGCSPKFTIGDDIYDDVLKDSLNYFYQNRSCDTIEEKYITSAGQNDSKSSLARKGMMTPDTAYIQTKWVKQYQKDSSDVETEKKLSTEKGWFDGTDFRKSSVDGAYSTWMLQNLYEWSKVYGSEKFEDESSAMWIPEYNNSAPDLLDEARYELEFLFDMIVADEESCAGMVYHEMCDSQPIGLANRCYDYINDYDDSVRIVRPATTPATLSVAAAAAQAARLWKDYDADFAAFCLENAEKVFAAALENPILIEGSSLDAEDTTADFVYDFAKEFYWAASELYITTGEEEYLDKLESIKMNRSGENPGYIPMDAQLLGIYSLSLNQKTAEAAEAYLLETAEELLEISNAQPYGLPYEGVKSELGITYEKNSNGIVATNAITLAYAFRMSEEKAYMIAATEALDYLLGRNPIGISYVTDSNRSARAVEEQTHNFWSHGIDSEYPYAPSGVLVGGPCNTEITDYLKGAGFNKDIPAQKFYADDGDSPSTNSVSATLNAPLAWLLSFADDHSTVDLTNDEPGEAVMLLGDATADNIVDISDVILVSRLAAEDTTIEITEKGKKLADVNEDEKIDASDANAILRMIAKLK